MESFTDAPDIRIAGIRKIWNDEVHMPLGTVFFGTHRCAIGDGVFWHKHENVLHRLFMIPDLLPIYSIEGSKIRKGGDGCSLFR